MSFLIKDIELLEKCNEIWEKVSNSIKKNLKNLKIKIRSYEGKVNTNIFTVAKYQKKVLNVYLSIINFDRFYF